MQYKFEPLEGGDLQKTFVCEKFSCEPVWEITDKKKQTRERVDDTFILEKMVKNKIILPAQSINELNIQADNSKFLFVPVVELPMKKGKEKEAEKVMEGIKLGVQITGKEQPKKAGRPPKSE